MVVVDLASPRAVAKDLEVIEVHGPVAVPVADGRAELHGMDFVVAAWRGVVAVSGVVDPRAGGGGS
jgi:hypothetical protein